MASTKTNTIQETLEATKCNRQKLLFFSLILLIFLFSLKLFHNTLLYYRLGTVNDFHLGFKPVFHYRKPHTYATFIGAESENKMQKLFGNVILPPQYTQQL